MFGLVLFDDNFVTSTLAITKDVFNALSPILYVVIGAFGVSTGIRWFIKRK